MTEKSRRIRGGGGGDSQPLKLVGKERGLEKANQEKGKQLADKNFLQSAQKIPSKLCKASGFQFYAHHEKK